MGRVCDLQELSCRDLGRASIAFVRKLDRRALRRLPLNSWRRLSPSIPAPVDSVCLMRHTYARGRADQRDLLILRQSRTRIGIETEASEGVVEQRLSNRYLSHTATHPVVEFDNFPLASR